VAIATANTRMRRNTGGEIRRMWLVQSSKRNRVSIAEGSNTQLRLLTVSVRNILPLRRRRARSLPTPTRKGPRSSAVRGVDRLREQLC
jgi:hypothetical protein